MVRIQCCLFDLVCCHIHKYFVEKNNNNVENLDKNSKIKRSPTETRFCSLIIKCNNMVIKNKMETVKTINHSLKNCIY